jgi:putative nucleotidyltransferase with HDIG domain
VSKNVEAFVASLGLDAYVVGGAVRDALLGAESKDADFLIAGIDIDALRKALEAHGRAEELVVAGRTVGIRFFPRDRKLRAETPAGIELAPPRREISTGPGRHDFDIVVDPAATVEEDLARRDFTVNAMARRLSDGTLVDPFGGRDDLERRVLRTVSPRSFAEDPLRLVRGLRFVSQLSLEPDDSTLEQMKTDASGIANVSGERIGGGIAGDSLGELSKLLLGSEPARALRLARDTGVLVELLPEFIRAADLSEHIFDVVQETAIAGDVLAVRLAALTHDLGKPLDADPVGHARVGAEIADRILRRLRYPERLTRRVVAIVHEHPFQLEKISNDAAEARVFLRRYGEELAFDLVAHRRADARAKRLDVSALDRFGELLQQELNSPFRLSDLAVSGDDLLTVGYRPGPALGETLERLLDEVVADPSLNEQTTLLRRAEELLR